VARGYLRTAWDCEECTQPQEELEGDATGEEVTCEDCGHVQTIETVM
jgi:hypothetical protein